MRDKYVKAILIAVGYFLFPIAADVGLSSITVLASLLLVCLDWWAYRLIRLIRLAAYRRGAPEWDREEFGFAAGVVCASVAMIAMLAVALLVRGPDERTITAATQGALEYALEAYRADVGKYPTTETGLRALISNPGAPRWAGLFIRGDLLRYIDSFDYSMHGEEKSVLLPPPATSEMTEAGFCSSRRQRASTKRIAGLESPTRLYRGYTRCTRE